MTRIRIHFIGDIAAGHTISMRSLGKSLSHLQSAVDRAYLDLKHGAIWKHARLQSEDYQEIQFVTGISQEGGYILDFLANTPVGKTIVNRISTALSPAIDRAMEGGNKKITNFAEQIEMRKAQIEQSILIPAEYEVFRNNPPEQVTRKYGDRSIVKEFDQIASIIRSPNTSDDSMIEFQLTGDKNKTFIFDKRVSKNFHSIVSEKILGEPIIYLVKIKLLDHRNMKGSIRNISSGKDANIYFVSEEQFFKAHPFLGSEFPVKIVGCPLIEYGAFDLKAGDIYFLDIIQDDG
jgi:hypothetical protein